MKRGFSLVELSIVLVILGLLVGGILAGKSLIRASELRAVGTEYHRWQTAIAAFRDKYLMLPGDLSNAQSFWGSAAACPGTHAQPSTTMTTCNGDGDGMIEHAPGGSFGNEFFRFWQHLANAGLIEGQFSGVRGSAGTQHSVSGVNVPASKFPGACWTFGSQPTAITGNGEVFDMAVGNTVVMGAPPTGNGSCRYPLLKPEDLWNIDTKLDDGRPGRGKIVARYWNDCTDAGSGADFDANYDLSVNTGVCSLQGPARW